MPVENYILHVSQFNTLLLLVLPTWLSSIYQFNIVRFVNAIIVVSIIASYRG